MNKFDYKWLSVDGVHGTRTPGDRMVGADESTELWRYPYSTSIASIFFYLVVGLGSVNIIRSKVLPPRLRPFSDFKILWKVPFSANGKGEALGIFIFLWNVAERERERARATPSLMLKNYNCICSNGHRKSCYNLLWHQNQLFFQH